METKIRKHIIDYIKNNLVNVNDGAVVKIHDRVASVIKDNMDKPDDKNNQLTRYEQIIGIENNLKYMTKQDLEDIKSLIIDGSVDEETKEEKMLRVTLEIINKLFAEMGRKEVRDLCEAIDIQRSVILKEQYKNIVIDNLKYIFDNGFSKSECMIYQKAVKTPHMSVLKGMLKSIGYEFRSKQTHRTINGVRTEDTFYSIKKIQDA
jgi:hypothetical protein